jgi:hypothetical protein
MFIVITAWLNTPADGLLFPECNTRGIFGNYDETLTSGRLLPL